MHEQHLNTQLHRRRDSLGHCVWNIVKFQIKKDRAAHTTNPAYNLRSRIGKELAAYFESSDNWGQVAREAQSSLFGRNIQSNKDRVTHKAN